MWWLAHDLTLHTRTHTHMPNRAARRTATTHAHPGLAVHTRDVYSRTCSSYAVRARRAGARRGAPSRTRCGIGSSRPSQKPWAPSPKGRRLASGDERGERFFLVASSKIEAILIQSILNYDNLTFILQRESRKGAMLPRAARFSARAAGARSARSPGMLHRSSPLACTPAHHPLAIATAHKNLTGSASASATATATAATVLSATSAGGAPLLHAVRGMSKKAKKSKGGALSDDDASADSATAGFLMYIPIFPICRTPFSPHFRI